MAAKRLLFLPDRTHNWANHPSHSAADYPIAPGGAALFPFPPPTVFDAQTNQLGPMLHVPLKPKSLAGSPLRARFSSTKPTPAIDALGAKMGGILNIKHCATFADHLIRYAHAESQHLQEMQVTTYPEQTMRSSWSADRTVHNATLPTAATQCAAIDRLAAQYVNLSVGKSVSLNSELSMLIDAHREILDLVNAWMQTRYERDGNDPTP
ncbi:uncharacterized protein PHACADRAFT_259932 [Phanerochaete carnosa HHB-10118-sp]|uniref:Uncharacterized protein n=1 Tax=Phanerochaete carnosa (strain HHB-10118-sp) TaxID=650164 RepID=K5W303_PHACS|nr:uncharacterized protein PHACADRAFT_259932 [Phanerochaete carnosa HHB-10118-sp]EKM53515.1 hypothetical protein PHACADRAFT_259932 [Phanerochaete carnosa HHB-10118-sp]